MVFDSHSSEFTRPVQALPLDNAGVPTFIRRHGPFFVLVAVVVSQLMLLGLQITRTNNVRLIRFWAVEGMDPFERSIGGLANVASTAFQTYGHLWHAEQENRELHLQLVAAQAQIQTLSEEAGEAERLRSLMGFRKQAPMSTVAAEVIGSSLGSTASPGENSNAISIDKGADAGLTADLAVITPGGVVGKILAVFPHSAQVLLLTDPASGVGAILSQSRVEGILKGGADGFCNLHYVMNEEDVKRGEQVLTSGLDQVYPKGLPIGTVVSVGEGNIYKIITVKPAVDLNRLELVLVVLKTSPVVPQSAMLPARHK